MNLKKVVWARVVAAAKYVFGVALPIGGVT